MSRLTLIVLLVGLIPSPVRANNCYYGGVRQGSYYNHNVGYYQHGGHNYYNYRPQQYAQPHYQPHYQPPYEYAQKVVAQEITVAPLIVTVPVVSHAMPIHNYGPTHYYSTQEQYQQKASIRDIIREELRSFVSGQTSPAARPVSPATPAAPVTPVTPGSSPPLYPSTQPSTPAQAVTDLGEDTQTAGTTTIAVVAAFTETGCFRCHGSGNVTKGSGNVTKGNLRLGYDKGSGNWTLARQTPERRWVIYGMASTGMMPPEARQDASKAMKQNHLPELLRWVLEAK